MKKVKKVKKVIVVGGGPAGMMAAYAAACNGNAVTLLEKNEKLGKKLYLTGKGRCNLTNACDTEALVEKVNANPRFLYSAFSTFGSSDLMDFFTRNGLPLAVERGNRVFPASNRASDVTKTLEKCLRNLNVCIILGQAVQSLALTDGVVNGVRTAEAFYPADAVIIATGGLSYPTTGATGDGFALAKSAGHAVTKLYPALVPLITREQWVADAAGLGLKNIALTATLGGKTVYHEMGELLFTHTGVSGPVVLSASRYLTGRFHEQPLLSIDLKPALSPERLDERIWRDFQTVPNKHFINALDKLLPQALIPVVANLSEIPPTRKVHEVTRAERIRLGAVVKNLTVTPVETAGFGEAVITAGGVSVREVNPSTMASKRVRHLFFAGEVLDVDAMTGGYNLQIAFSTGHLAGSSL